MPVLQRFREIDFTIGCKIYNWMHGKTTKFLKEVCHLGLKGKQVLKMKRPPNFYWHIKGWESYLAANMGSFLQKRKDNLEDRAKSHWKQWNRKITSRELNPLQESDMFCPSLEGVGSMFPVESQNCYGTVNAVYPLFPFFWMARSIARDIKVPVLSSSVGRWEEWREILPISWEIKSLSQEKLYPKSLNCSGTWFRWKDPGPRIWELMLQWDETFREGRWIVVARGTNHSSLLCPHLLLFTP